MKPIRPRFSAMETCDCLQLGDLLKDFQTFIKETMKFKFSCKHIDKFMLEIQSQTTAGKSKGHNTNNCQ